MSKINIENYLTEDQKQEIAEDEYRRLIRLGLEKDNFRFKTLHKKERISNLDRILSNAVYYILENESDEILGSSVDLKKTIKNNVKKTILERNDYSYSIFRSKGTFDKEDSIGQQILTKAVVDQTEYIKEKVKKSIDKFFKEKSPDEWNDWIQDIVTQTVCEKFNIEKI